MDDFELFATTVNFPNRKAWDGISSVDFSNCPPEWTVKVHIEPANYDTPYMNRLFMYAIIIGNCTHTIRYVSGDSFLCFIFTLTIEYTLRAVINILVVLLIFYG